MATTGATAYFITWSWHEQWLNGDERGSVDRMQNVYGTPMLAPHRGLNRSDADYLTQQPFILSDRQRVVVDSTIRKHLEIRGWLLLAIKVRTTHVHVVLGASGYSPEKVMGELKAWSSRRMQEAGLLDRCAKVWTRHGSTRHIFRDVGLSEAIHYVNHEQ